VLVLGRATNREKVLASVAPLGTTSVGGRSVDRFDAPASTPLDLVTVFETTTAIKQPDVGTLELDANSDGSLARVVIHLTSDDFDYSDVMPSGMASDVRTYDYTFDFDAIGAPVTLPDPGEATKHYHAKRFGLSLDVPPVGSWTSADPEHDELSMPESPGVVVRTGGHTVSATDAADQESLLQNETSASIQDFINHGAVPVGVERAEIDGKPAYLFAVKSAEGASQPFFHLEAYVVSGRHVWWVNWHAFHPDDAGSLVDRYRFEQVLASMTLD